jgi:hypothetical protein
MSNRTEFQQPLTASYLLVVDGTPLARIDVDGGQWSAVTKGQVALLSTTLMDSVGELWDLDEASQVNDDIAIDLGGSWDSLTIEYRNEPSLRPAIHSWTASIKDSVPSRRRVLDAVSEMGIPKHQSWTRP